MMLHMMILGLHLKDNLQAYQEYLILETGCDVKKWLKVKTYLAESVMESWNCLWDYQSIYF